MNGTPLESMRDRIRAAARDERGSMLIDSLIAMAIGALVLGAFALFYFSANGASNQTSAHTGQEAQGVEAVNRFVQDVSTASKADTASSQDVVVEHDTVSSTTKKPVINLVRWQVQTQEGGTSNLVRQENDGATSSSFAVTANTITQVEATNVDAAKTKFTYHLSDGSTSSAPTDPTQTARVDIAYGAQTGKSNIVLNSSAALNTPLTGNGGNPLAPVAVNDSGTVNYGYSTTVPVLSNDTFSGTAAIHLTTSGLPTGASASLTADGKQVIVSVASGFDYVSNPTFTFTYTITDASGMTSNTATVTITVANPPVPVEPAAPSLLNCGGLAVTIPSTTGVTYQINGTTYPAGLQTGFTGTVTVTATPITSPAPGYRIAQPTGTDTYTVSGGLNGIATWPSVAAGSLPACSLNAWVANASTSTYVPGGTCSGIYSSTQQANCGETFLDWSHVPYGVPVAWKTVDGGNASSSASGLDSYTTSSGTDPTATNPYTLAATPLSSEIVYWIDINKNGVEDPNEVAVTSVQYPDVPKTTALGSDTNFNGVVDNPGLNTVKWTSHATTTAFDVLRYASTLDSVTGAVDVVNPVTQSSYAYNEGTWSTIIGSNTSGVSATSSSVTVPGSAGTETLYDVVATTQCVTSAGAAAISCDSLNSDTDYRTANPAAYAAMTAKQGTAAPFGAAAYQAPSDAPSGLQAGTLDPTADCATTYTNASGGTSATNSAGWSADGSAGTAPSTLSTTNANNGVYDCAAGTSYTSAYGSGNAQTGTGATSTYIQWSDPNTDSASTSATDWCSYSVNASKTLPDGDGFCLVQGSNNNDATADRSVTTTKGLDSFVADQSDWNTKDTWAVANCNPGGCNTIPAKKTLVSFPHTFGIDSVTEHNDRNTYTYEFTKAAGANQCWSDAQIGSSITTPHCGSHTGTDSVDFSWGSLGTTGTASPDHVRFTWTNVTTTASGYPAAALPKVSLGGNPADSVVCATAGAAAKCSDASVSSDTGDLSAVQPNTKYEFQVQSHGLDLVSGSFNAASASTSHYYGLYRLGFDDDSVNTDDPGKYVDTTPDGDKNGPYWMSYYSNPVQPAEVHESAFCDAAHDGGWNYGYQIQEAALGITGGKAPEAGDLIRDYYWTGEMKTTTVDASNADLLYATAGKFLVSASTTNWAAATNWTETTATKTGASYGTNYYATTSGLHTWGSWDRKLIGGNTGDNLIPRVGLNASNLEGVAAHAVGTYITQASAGDPDFADTHSWSGTSGYTPEYGNPADGTNMEGEIVTSVATDVTSADTGSNCTDEDSDKSLKDNTGAPSAEAAREALSWGGGSGTGETSWYAVDDAQAVNFRFAAEENGSTYSRSSTGLPGQWDPNGTTSHTGSWYVGFYCSMAGTDQIDSTPTTDNTGYFCHTLS